MATTPLGELHPTDEISVTHDWSTTFTLLALVEAWAEAEGLPWPPTLDIFTTNINHTSPASIINM